MVEESGFEGHASWVELTIDEVSIFHLNVYCVVGKVVGCLMWNEIWSFLLSMWSWWFLFDGLLDISFGDFC